MFGAFPFASPYFGQGNASTTVLTDAYQTDFVWVEGDRLAAVDSDARVAWVPALSDREVER